MSEGSYVSNNIKEMVNKVIWQHLERPKKPERVKIRTNEIDFSSWVFRLCMLTEACTVTCKKYLRQL
jgi:hypothetical protein